MKLEQELLINTQYINVHSNIYYYMVVQLILFTIVTLLLAEVRFGGVPADYTEQV